MTHIKQAFKKYKKSEAYTEEMLSNKKCPLWKFWMSWSVETFLILRKNFRQITFPMPAMTFMDASGIKQRKISH